MNKLWLDKHQIDALPTTGSAFDTVVKYANAANGTAILTDQNSAANVNCLAAALIYARSGDATAKQKVLASISQLCTITTLERALALGRELCAYVFAADLIELPTLDAALDANFKTKLRWLLTAPTSGGPANLLACQKQRPNNWGMHATASIAAVYAYLGDQTDLDACATIFHGWLGDRTKYSGFSYTAPLSWHADPSNPVGINPAGATIQGHNVDGVLPDDMRRGGGFAWPPPGGDGRMYSWEALQGAIVVAQILARQGYPAWDWCDKALLRAVQFLYRADINWPADGDDAWQPWLINFVYGTNFTTSATATPGKNMGFTQWTHAQAADTGGGDTGGGATGGGSTGSPTDAQKIVDALAALKTVQAAIADVVTALGG